MDLTKKILRAERVRRLKPFFSLFLAVLLTGVLLPGPALAADAADAVTGTIAGAVRTGMRSVYGLITSIVLPIAAVIFAFAGLKMLIGGQRDIEAGQGKLLAILLVLIIVYFAPLIIEAMGSWFSGASESTSIWGAA